MLFNLILLIIVAAIAYFHYVQGLFSSALSAILCILAAVTAVGYHETLAYYINTYMKAPEYAVALSLITIFLLAYLIPRLTFDNLVPGNLRFPVLMDKIGAGAMGLVAGLFATGVLALAAESLPFGASIAGYSRQALGEPRNVTISGGAGNGRSQDTTVSEELVGDSFGDPSELQHLWLHQDDLVLGVTRQLSGAGASLSNGAPLDSVHPDYALELFGQRLGIPGGIRRLIVPDDKNIPIRVDSAFMLAKVPPHIDGVVSSVRGDQHPADPPPDATLVIVRTTISSGPGMTDPTDTHLRTSPAGVRLKAGDNDYFPLGTMVGGTLLIENRPDDPLIIDLSKGNQTVDFLFAVSPDDVKEETNSGVKTVRFLPGTFLEIMRYAQADLGGMTISTESPQTQVKYADGDASLGGVMHQQDIITQALQKVSAISVPATGQKATGNNPPPAPDNLRGKDNEFLPSLPGHLMGL